VAGKVGLPTGHAAYGKAVILEGIIRRALDELHEKILFRSDTSLFQQYSDAFILMLLIFAAGHFAVLMVKFSTAASSANSPIPTSFLLLQNLPGRLYQSGWDHQIFAGEVKGRLILFD